MGVFVDDAVEAISSTDVLVIGSGSRQFPAADLNPLFHEWSSVSASEPRLRTTPMLVLARMASKSAG
jgi:hypothetical protein